jgi:hypothetical protein
MTEKNTCVVVAGCGGLLYHAMPGLACLYDDAYMHFVDPDTVESHNRSRQWGQENEPKADLACRMWETLVGGGNAEAWGCKVSEMPTPDDIRGVSCGAERVVVLALPDNDAARLDAWLLFHHLAFGREGIFLMAGNDLKYGHAYGVRADCEESLLSLAQYKEIYQAIWDEADKEAEGEVRTMHCMDHIRQSMVGNHLTAGCLLETLDLLEAQEINEGESVIVEASWSEYKDTKKIDRITTIYDKYRANQETEKVGAS